MSQPIASPSHELEFKSYHDWNGDRPSQTLIVRDNSSIWWTRVEISWSLPESIRRLGYYQRPSVFQQFIKAIDFGQLHLLDDTVTLITLTVHEQSNQVPMRKIQDNSQTIDSNYFLSIAHQISSYTEEDQLRVIYPTPNQALGLPTFEGSDLKDSEFITPTVAVTFNNKRYAYKTIDRLNYAPGDSDDIMNEITALAQFRGQPNIAQLIGVVIADDPYKSRPPKSQVITGFLLEFYPEGSLQEVLSDNHNLDDSLLRRWALQIGRALETLHTQQRTHLDIKTTNIVLDADKNAILIDISGTGGYTWEWLSPEMQNTIQQSTETPPAETSFSERVATDCWAYGRVLSMMARKTTTRSLGDWLQSISDDLMKTDLKDRISLSDALKRIQDQE